MKESKEENGKKRDAEEEMEKVKERVGKINKKIVRM